MRLTISRFSCKYGYLRYPLSRSLAVLSGFSLPTPLNRPFRRTAAVSLLGLWSSCNASYRNIHRLSIRFASRLPLRSRLTLIRLTLFRKPWGFGVYVSVIHCRYLCLHFLFQTLQQTSRFTFDADWNAPLPRIIKRVLSFGDSFYARSSSTHHRSTSELLRTL